MLFLGDLGLRLELGLEIGLRLDFQVRVGFGVRENRILNGMEFCVPTRLVVRVCVCVCVFDGGGGDRVGARSFQTGRGSIA